MLKRRFLNSGIAGSHTPGLKAFFPSGTFKHRLSIMVVQSVLVFAENIEMAVPSQGWGKHLQ